MQWYDSGVHELLQPELAPVKCRIEDGQSDVRDRLVLLAKRGIDELVLWLDCDPEGEAIGLEVVEELKEEIDLRAVDRVRRARFRSLHPDDVRAALGKLGRHDELLAQSVRAREELDLRKGYTYTRVLTMLCRTKLRRAEALLKGRDVGGRVDPLAVMSYGPCQSPALYLVCQRAESRLEAGARPPDTLELTLKFEGSATGGDCVGHLECCFSSAPATEPAQYKAAAAKPLGGAKEGIEGAESQPPAGDRGLAKPLPGAAHYVSAHRDNPVPGLLY